MCLKFSPLLSLRITSKCHFQSLRIKTLMTRMAIFHSPSERTHSIHQWRRFQTVFKEHQKYAEIHSFLEDHCKPFLFTFGYPLETSVCYPPMSAPGTTPGALIAWCGLSHFRLTLDCSCLDICHTCHYPWSIFSTRLQATLGQKVSLLCSLYHMLNSMSGI